MFDISHNVYLSKSKTKTLDSWIKIQERLKKVLKTESKGEKLFECVGNFGSTNQIQQNGEDLIANKLNIYNFMMI